jgi:hypothetical protein
MASIIGSITINQSNFFELDANPLLAPTPGVGLGDFCIVDGLVGIWQKTGTGDSDFARIDDTNSFTTLVTVNGTLALSASSDSIRVFTGSVAGQIVSLPNATTLALGRSFYFLNDSTTSITVRTFTGSTVYTMPPSSRLRVLLTDKSSSTGVWTTDATGISSASSAVDVDLKLESASVRADSSMSIGTRGVSVFSNRDTYLGIQGSLTVSLDGRASVGPNSSISVRVI